MSETVHTRAKFIDALIGTYCEQPLNATCTGQSASPKQLNNSTNKSTPHISITERWVGIARISDQKYFIVESGNVWMLDQTYWKAC